MIYKLYFANAGVPALGLTPTLSLVRVADGTAITPAPAVTETGLGWYKYSYTATEDVNGTADGGASLSNSDRYLPVEHTPQDALLDAAISSRASSPSVRTADETYEAFGYNLITGVLQSGAASDLASVNSAYFTFSPGGSTPLDVYLRYSCGTERPNQVLIKGRWAGSALSYTQVYAYDQRLAVWVELTSDSDRMNHSTTDQYYSYAIPLSCVSSSGDVLIRFLSSTTDDTHRLYLDMLVVTSTASDMTVASIADKTTGNLTPVIGAVPGAVWDANLGDHQTNGSAGKTLSDAGAAGDPWSSSVPGSYAAGTAGYKIGMIGAGNATVATPLASDLSLTIIKGDDYLATDGRGIVFTSEAWPTLTGGAAKIKIQTGSSTITEIAATIPAAKSVLVELTAVQTGALASGTAYRYDIEATLQNGHVVTLVNRSRLTVKQDVR